MFTPLAKIKKPIENELAEFQLFFRKAIKSNAPLLDKVLYYVIKHKGKQLRPIMVMLVCKIFSPITQKTFVAASLIELLHTASLIHDDIVDDSHLRRGMFSVNALWKNKIAVLSGDYLLSKGFLISLEYKAYRILEILSVAVKDMSEGELNQFEKSRKLDIDEQSYLHIIKQKTASLMAASCEAGAYSADVNEDIVKQMKLMGEYLGMAFQIKDDLLDYSHSNIGKPTGNDIRDRKITLPLINALANSSPIERKKMLYTLKNENNNTSKVNELIKIVHEKGGVEYSRKKMMEYKTMAKDILNTFPKNDAIIAFEELLEYLIVREK